MHAEANIHTVDLYIDTCVQKLHACSNKRARAYIVSMKGLTNIYKMLMYLVN